jgi:hypothetical protein
MSTNLHLFREMRQADSKSSEPALKSRTVLQA